MPTTLIIDRLEGTQATQTKDGIKVVRSALLSGVSGDSDARLLTALADAGLPSIGDPHPSDASLFVESLTAEPVSPDQISITIAYAPLKTQLVADDTATPQISVSTTTQTQETNLDYDGNILSVTYTPSGGEEDSQGGTVSKEIPQTILRLTRLETSSPLSKSMSYVGKINSGTFFSGAAGTWLCTGIEGNSSDGGDSYNVTYSFAYASSWQATISYIDPATGQPPSDVTLSPYNGLKKYTIYEEADFSSLNLE